MVKTEAAVEVLVAMAPGIEVIGVVIGEAAEAAVAAIEAVVTFRWAIECWTAIDLTR